MRAGLVSLVLAAGCSFRPVPATRAPDARGLDAAQPDAPCAFSSLFDTCALVGGGAQPLVLTGAYRYDTTMGALYQLQGAMQTPVSITRTRVTLATGPVEVLVASDVQLTPGTTLTAAGSFPLAILSSGGIELGGGALIDVGRGGAGARPTCPMGAARGGDESGGAGGGGGAGFGAAGGQGGTGNSDGTPGAPGAGGAAVALPTGLVGGCAGAGGGTGADPGGAGGAGGGAIYLGARGMITIAANAAIDAGGDGGAGATAQSGNGDAGGGGGGSGGMIVLEAARVQSDGVLAANGGAGGSGSGGGMQGMAGAPGPRSAARAMGGSDGGGTGTAGGDGGALPMAAGDPVMGSNKGGGGGGGGGVGFIVVRAPYMQLAVASPAAS